MTAVDRVRPVASTVARATGRATVDVLRLTAVVAALALVLVAAVVAVVAVLAGTREDVH